MADICLMEGITPLVGSAKVCERCGVTFTCCNNAVSAEPCVCDSIQLQPATLLYLRSTYKDCLCINCLHAIKAEKETAA